MQLSVDVRHFISFLSSIVSSNDKLTFQELKGSFTLEVDNELRIEVAEDNGAQLEVKIII